jgi:N-acetylglucosamine-6-sulfatase
MARGRIRSGSMFSSPRALGLPILLAALAFAACAPASERQTRAIPPTRPPNLVVVLVDDMRWDEMRVAGHPFIETPHMDRLAREGARFLNAFATTPLCSPSRANFLTGQYAHTNGILDNTARPSHSLPTFPLALAGAGYETAFFGKWHMGNDDTPRPGFSHWVGMAGQGEAVNPVLNVDGQRRSSSGYVTDILTDYAVNFIQRPRTAPFLVYLAHKAIHPNITQRDDGSTVEIPGQPGGFVAAERHRGRYLGRPMPRRPNALGPPTGKPALLRKIDDLPPLGLSTRTSDEEMRGRLEMLLAVDESLGRILETLERAGQLDNTVVVFTSDHGYFYGEHGLSVERRLAYEETIRIPLLVRYPRAVPAGRTPAELVLSIDLAPTLLEWANVHASPAMQGRSLVPLIAGERTGWRSSFLIEYYTDTVFPRVRNMGYVAVRSERHKLIHYLELDNMDEFYGLDADPYEQRNLIADPAAASALAAMRAELDRLMKTTGRPATPRKADP